MQQPTSDGVLSRAFEWVARDSGADFLAGHEYCPTRDVFQARLDHFNRELEQLPGMVEQSSLVVAIAGELGNNAFDHNLGSWRDVPGVSFVADLTERVLVIADRGQGILASLRRVQPSLTTDQAAIDTAFTQMVSGRAPERRGNGLKFVAAVARQHGFSIECYSGDGRYLIGNQAHDRAARKSINGVIAVLHF